MPPASEASGRPSPPAAAGPGPLHGLVVVELAGIGPGPFAGMLLADMGAEVIRVDRLSAVAAAPPERPATFVHDRGKAAMAVDLKQPRGAEVVLRLAEGADVLLEGFRPGVAERLGVGPAACLARNPGLVYGRITGWGQEGPAAPRAGHDIDYIALAGALEPLGRAGQPPTPPLNLLGDFAGGGMLLAFGVVCAAYARRGPLGSGGQVVDAAMIDGAALMLAPFYAARASGAWGQRGTNALDTGAHFYEVYETADHKWVAVGAIEPQFYAELLAGLGLDGDEGLRNGQWDKQRWPQFKAAFAEVFSRRTRQEWCEQLEGIDACFAPVLDPTEAPAHPHHRARETFIEVGGVLQPAPSPRLSGTPAPAPRPPRHPGADTGSVLRRFGFGDDEIGALVAAGVVC